MQLIKQERLTKTVDFFGVQIQVPEQAKFVAADADGRVFSSTRMPQRGFEGGWYVTHGYQVHCAKVNLEGVDWRQTRIETCG